MDDNWKVWDDSPEYGDNFYQRSIDEKEEMESSKSAAKIVSTIIKDKDIVLDVGCGAGHYLASLDKRVETNFSYHGVDATEHYIELAKKAYNGKSTEYRDVPSFNQEDIFNLSESDGYADVVMCNNVLLHLPKIEKPISELW
ncbi:MAG: methyltransferase domain-containing protein, partial [Sulfurimonas sp.]|nr:methyltransferase domain-containing protein [Sulfurimonas sp.]